jgi:hypothetical protein
MYNRINLGNCVVYADEALESRYIELNSESVVPFMTYIKTSSNELFTNLVDFSAEEVAVGYMRYNYVMQSLTLALKLVLYIYSELAVPMTSIVGIYRNAN